LSLYSFSIYTSSHLRGRKSIN